MNKINMIGATFDSSLSTSEELKLNESLNFRTFFSLTRDKTIFFFFAHFSSYPTMSVEE